MGKKGVKMNKRIKILKQYMAEKGLDSLLLTCQKNMRYISSYTGEGYMVLTCGTDYLVTDSRYTEQARGQAFGFEICDIASFCPNEAFGDLKATGFEDKSISYFKYISFAEIFKNLLPIGDFIYEMRAIKDKEEIESIRMAEHIGDMAFTHILDFIKPGVKEKDIALELEFFMRKNGAEAMSFDPIVASGANGAMPHAEPGDTLIKKGDFVVLDFGCVYGGYASDMTRTVSVGKANDEMKKIYNTVLKAQTTSLDMIKAGVLPSLVHQNALAVTDENYKGKFGHSLGHGVGLDVHEMPNLSVKNNIPLKTNNIVTVEPGIYINGFCGVRIEDLVLVTDDGIDNFSKSSKNLIEL